MTRFREQQFPNLGLIYAASVGILVDPRHTFEANFALNTGTSQCSEKTLHVWRLPVFASTLSSPLPSPPTLSPFSEKKSTLTQ